MKQLLLVKSTNEENQVSEYVNNNNLEYLFPFEEETYLIDTINANDTIITAFNYNDSTTHVIRNLQEINGIQNFNSQVVHINNAYLLECLLTILHFY